MERRRIFWPVFKREQRLGKNVRFKEDNLSYQNDIPKLNWRATLYENRTGNTTNIFLTKTDDLYEFFLQRKGFLMNIVDLNVTEEMKKK